MSDSVDPFQYPVLIWTSSHGTDRHHLPSKIHKIYESNTKFSKHMLPPVINAKPGRLMNDSFLNEYKTEFFNFPPSQPRLHLVLMGDNDIRGLGMDGGYRVYDKSKKLIELHSGSNQALLLFGLMPSPATHNHSSGVADYCDFRIRQEVEKENQSNNDSKIGLVRTSLFFDDRSGFLNHKLYFEKDMVHLNARGAQCLATNMLGKALSFLQVISDPSQTKVNLVPSVLTPRQTSDI